MHNYSCGGRWLLRLLFTIGNSQINFNPQARGIGSMDELQISPADSRESPGKEQQAAGVGILLQIMMLVLSFVLGHVLRRRRFYYLPEASASLLIGAWHRHESLCFGLWGVCLNDAMAISLYRTMSLMRSHISSEQNFFMVYAGRRAWSLWYCMNIVHWNCYEALHIRKFVRQFAAFCVCFFPSDIIIG